MTTKNQTHTLNDYFVHGIFYTLYGIVKYLPSPIGDWLRFLVVKPFVKKMGKVKIKEGVTFVYPYKIELGNNVTLNEGVILDGYGGLTIGDDVRIGHRTSVLSSEHIINKKDIPIYKQGLLKKNTSIKKDVLIGCKAIILKGITVEKGAVIGAGAVVMKDISEYSIVLGNPARKICSR
ncbi:MAG: acyltransferase [archaeon]